MADEFFIRSALFHDWDEIIGIYNYYILNTTFNFEYDAYTLESRLPWFQQFQNQTAYQLLVSCNQANQVVAYAATTPFSQIAGYHASVKISIYCRSGYTNKGIGSMLLKTLIEQSQSTNIHKMYAGITIPNDASIQLFHKHDFKQTAYFKEIGYKFNRYWDVAWLERCANNELMHK